MNLALLARSGLDSRRSSLHYDRMLTPDLFVNSARAPEVEAAVWRMADHDDTERGAIFTRPDVVAAILDLSGYRDDLPLHRMRMLEPSFGAGDFLLPAVERLLVAYVKDGGTPARALSDLGNAVCAVELHATTFADTRATLRARLVAWGMLAADAEALCQAWLQRDDFLLSSLQPGFDVVIGNPPYVRQERIPAALLGEYRRRFHTLYDRADLYVPFFERSLDLLAEGGALGFICANRWLKNRYGGPLREKIASEFWLQYFIDTEGADAFHVDVIAYPAITVIRRPRAGESGVRKTRVVHAEAVESRSLSQLASALLSEGEAAPWIQQIEWTNTGSAPLLLDDLPRLQLMQRIELRYPELELVGCKVGIGVATGCDRVYLGALDDLPVEPSRKLPLVMARDLTQGGIRWGGMGVVNPFDDDGSLVDLGCYPELRDYLTSHRDALRRRNVAKRQPVHWYRTIDRIQSGLLETPKLLVPDIKGEGVFALDEGHYYPHHNLYYIVSDQWDLRALQAVLRSSVTLMTVATYCTRMAGGFLRFQAQYLRRIRLPRWIDIAPSLRERLIRVAEASDQSAVDAPVFELYGLDKATSMQIRAIADTARVTKESQ